MLSFCMIFHSFEKKSKKFPVAPIPVPPGPQRHQFSTPLAISLVCILLSLASTILDSNYGITVSVDKDFCISEYILIYKVSFYFFFKNTINFLSL